MVVSCPRCGAPLPLVEGDPPSFCSACGLPQLRISADAVVSGTPAETESDTLLRSESVHMPRALRVVAIAGALAVTVASLLPGALVSGAVGGLLLLFTPVIVAAAVYAYSRSRPPVLASPTSGARLGALLGLWMGTLFAVVTGIAGFVLRYGYHSHAIDEKIQQAAAQVPTQLQAAGPPSPELLQMLQTPEFLAGSFILGHVLSLLLLVLAGAVCGWMAATVLRARRQRTID